jgi:ribulose-phosphate 3-epimerase
MAHQLFPSILSADFGNLQRACEMLNESKADAFHLDVMDGMFVPNISFGFPIIKTIQKYAKKPLDVHLMIVEPERYLERFKDAGASILTVHLETCKDMNQTIKTIKELGMKVCIAINPQTSISLLSDSISHIDSVCVMSVNPGFGGQTFIENTFSKVEQLKEMIRIKKSNALIKIDGGVNMNNCRKLLQVGADILVAGTAIFGAQNPLRAIEEFKRMDDVIF